MSETAGKIAIGTVQFGLDYGIKNASGVVPEDEVRKILDLGIEMGLDCIDTARGYGESELVIGRYNRRHEYRIITKIPAGTSMSTAGNVFEESLERLNCSRIYGLLFHDFSDFKNEPELYEYGQLQVQEGRVEKLGFSLYEPRDLEYLFEQNVKFDLVQVPYNLLDRKFEVYFEILKERSIEVHTRSVFLQGLMLMKPADVPGHLKGLLPAMAELSSIAGQYGMSVEQLALNFALQHPDIDRVVVGVDNYNQFLDNINNAKEKFGEDLICKLRSLNVTNPDLVNPSKWVQK